MDSALLRKLLKHITMGDALGTVEQEFGLEPGTLDGIKEIRAQARRKGELALMRLWKKQRRPVFVPIPTRKKKAPAEK